MGTPECALNNIAESKWVGGGVGGCLRNLLENIFWKLVGIIVNHVNNKYCGLCLN
jgi:hypothetical protein